jgi:hypothetical protein
LDKKIWQGKNLDKKTLKKKKNQGGRDNLKKKKKKKFSDMQNNVKRHPKGDVQIFCTSP